MTPLRPVDLIPVVQGWEILTPLCEPWIIKGCEESGEWDIHDIAEGLQQNKMHLWACCRFSEGSRLQAVIGAGVTQVKKLKNGLLRGEVIVFAGEHIELILPLRDRLKLAFRESGCSSWRVHGRQGWGRRFPEMKLVGIILEERIADKMQEVA